MCLKKDVFFLHDQDGKLAAVQVSPELWRRIEPHLKRLVPVEEDEIAAKTMGEFGDFMRFWDFPYPYDPSVACPACGASARDWRADESRSFSLRNANIGGLLVFHCNGCGATIRHKYFKDHMAVEHSPEKFSG